MTAAKYNTFRKQILDHAAGVTPYTPPTNVKARLFTVAPTAAGGGTPVSGNGYTDVTIPWNGTYMGAATSTGITNLGHDLDLGFANGGNWGTIVAIDFRDAATNSLMWYATLDTPIAILDGQGLIFRAASNDIVWTES